MDFCLLNLGSHCNAIVCNCNIFVRLGGVIEPSTNSPIRLFGLSYPYAFFHSFSFNLSLAQGQGSSLVHYRKLSLVIMWEGIPGTLTWAFAEEGRLPNIDLSLGSKVREGRGEGHLHLSLDCFVWTRQCDYYIMHAH